MVALLASAGHCEANSCWVPGSNACHFTQALVCLPGQLLGVPACSPTFHAMALGDPDDVYHLVLRKDGRHRDGFFQPLPCPVHLLRHAAPVELHLHHVSLLLSQWEQTHLRVHNHTDHPAVLLHGRKVLCELLLSAFILPLLTVLGEGLLLALVPEIISWKQQPLSVEATLALVADVLSKDGLEGTQAMDSLHIAHHPNNYHRGSLNDGHRLKCHMHGFHTQACAVHFSQGMGHARLVAHEGGEVDGLLGVILGPAANPSPVPAAALAREEAQVTVSRENVLGSQWLQ
uniref:Uncharacterized protein n=1 Tax=Scleropages formosus TaxID=113540 RepID=A0A8C9SIT7_SCLFO